MRIVFGTMLILLLIFAVPIVSADHNVFYLEPVDSNCNPGDDTTAWVMVNTSYDDINSFQASLIFDPSVVNITHAEKGTPDWYLWEFIGGDYGDDKKWISVRGADLMNTFGPGDLQLGLITLHGEGSGISSLHFANESELGQDRTEIAHPDGVIWPITKEDGTFTCTGPADTFDKTLMIGWNLVSLPLTPSDNSLATVLASIDGNYDAVNSYNAATNEFEDATTMDPGTGYFIHMTAGDTWSYEGQAFNSMSESLTTGLNCVGWENTNASLPDALSSIDYRYVSKWNANDQKYEVYDVNAPSGFNDFDMMERGEGYFIAATADCMLSP